MSFPRLAVARPVFISSLVLLMLFAGWQSLKTLPIELFPQADLPFVTVSTLYPGAGPKEVETSISKVLEEEFATLEGAKKITATSQDSLSIMVVEFRPGVALDSAEQRLRDKVALAKTKFPKEAKEPLIERLNPSNQPIVSVFLQSEKLSRIELTDWATNELKPLLSRIPRVGRVELVGAQKREIHIVVDPKKIADYRTPLLTISSQLQNGGQNVPGGTLKAGTEEIGLRALAQFNKLSDIESRIVSFNNLERPVRVKDLAVVKDASEKETTKGFVNGKAGVVAHIYKQTGANTIAVANSIKAEIARIDENAAKAGTPRVSVVRDGSQMVRDNVDDVWESILIGVALTIVVVYFFLGSIRSTLITGFAIPNSLMGAFVLMGVAGFSVNILTLLALSLCVGLLVDDAIVVRENIFKHLEKGSPPKKAAIEGAEEVAMAVVAVTAAILSMFGPVGFLKGTVGAFFREFGLVVCFAMLVSLFDAMAVAPMLSAYWAGANPHGKAGTGILSRLVKKFDQFQSFLETRYEKLLYRALRFPLTSMALVVGLAVLAIFPASQLPSGFLPTDQSSEFSVRVNLPPGTNLETTASTAAKVDEWLRRQSFVDQTVLTVGNAQQEVAKAELFVKLKDKSARLGKKPSEIRDKVREELAKIGGLPPGTELLVVQFDPGGAGIRPFSLVLQSSQVEGLKETAERIFAELTKTKGLTGLTLELKEGGRELLVDMNKDSAQRLGISAGTAGLEIRGRNEGLEVGKLREKGREYDIRLTTSDAADVWLKRDREILVPNVNMIPVDLRRAAAFTESRALSKIERLNRSYAARISADLASGASLADVLREVDSIVAKEKAKNPNLSHSFEGDSESYEELSGSMGKAMLFGIVLLFLVLASLYESFLLSFLNIVTLPLAISGAFLALFVMNDGLHLYSFIGLLLLLGVATKNSILLVDTAIERLKAKGVKEGPEELRKNIASASVRRLRPILMTSFALAAGTIPIAIGLNEASAQRTGMGIAIIGGTISSTLFTLILIPSLLVTVEKARAFLAKFRRQKPQVAHE